MVIVNYIIIQFNYNYVLIKVQKMFCNKLLEFNQEILYRLIGKISLFIITLAMSFIKFQFDNSMRIK